MAFVIVTVSPGDDVGFPSPVIDVRTSPNGPKGGKAVTVIIDADALCGDGRTADGSAHIPPRRLQRLVELAARKAIAAVPANRSK